MSRLLDRATTQPRSRSLQTIGGLALIALSICFMIFAMGARGASNRDFICYWATGQQLVHHGNPYDGDAILRLERTAGFEDDRPLFMRNPPSALFLAYPLGFVGTRAGAVLWSIALITALMVSIRLLWIMQGRPRGRVHLVGYCFPPAVACVFGGQLGIFLLLGVVLFLRFHESYPYLSGAALLLCSPKPHLFLPVIAVLFTWILTQRQYRILAGAVTALAGSLLLSYYLDPHAWTQYLSMAKDSHINLQFIPTASLLFRLAIRPHIMWLQFVPALVSCVWALHYFWTRRLHWQWTDQGLLLLLVSVVVAPYAWFTDDSIVLPAMLACLFRTSKLERTLLWFGLVAGVAMIELLVGAKIVSLAFIWTPPAWLALYLSSRRVPIPTST